MTLNESTTSTDQAKLKGYHEKWVDARYLFGCAFFSELLNASSVLSKALGLETASVDHQKDAVSLSKNEENALRYAAGFVPFQLMKKMRTMSDIKFQPFLTCLSRVSVTDQSDLADHNYTSFGDYTFQWLSLQDRGRLFKVNDQTYDFFDEFEKAVRPLLHEKLTTTRKGAEDDLSSTILQNSEVCKCWEKISSSYVRGNESDELLAAIFLSG